MGNPIEEEYGTKFPEHVLNLLKRVELDMYKTRIALFKERFIHTFNDWCHRNNVQSRMQAYGRGMHPLEASMEIDIPECETWLFKDVGREYPNTGLKGRGPRMCNKYVSSGAVLAGKKIVSCEEITNTEMAFMATLENIKVTGDQSNISGVNHSILHGFNYSPPEAEFPGWIRYGAYFNERNTWWPYFNKWANYKARISFLLQNANPRANVAILQPLIDLWLKMGPQRDPFPQKWYPEYQNNLWEAVHQNGGGCDYVSENIIKKSTFKSGKMRYGDRSYTTMLLPEIETMDLEVAEALVAFANSGGKIVFIGKVPYKSTSYDNMEAEDAKVKGIINDLFNNKKENVIRYPAPTGDLIEWYGKLQDELALNPYIKLHNTHKYLNQSSYLIDQTPVFFLANTSLSEHISVKAEFRTNEGLSPWIWNPETGERSCYPNNSNGKSLNLEIPHASSVLLVFEKNNAGEQLQEFNFKPSGKEITGEWQLQLHHMNGEKKRIQIETLNDLLEIDPTKSFAGEVIYEKTITNTQTDYEYLDLGNVQGISELTLNNELIGTRWYGAHVYNIKNKLQKGQNKISIKLTTITGNYLKSMKDNKVAQNWTKHQDYYPMGILGPVRLV